MSQSESLTLGGSTGAALEKKPPASLLEVIAQAVCDPRMDIEKMERLFQLQKEIVAEERKVAFDAALSRLQSVLPQIDKHGKGKNSKFAKLEDIDVIIRPFLAKEGFAFSFDEKQRNEKTVTFVGILSHSEGHRETKQLTVSIDVAAKNSSGNSVRPAIQDDASTVSYARRYLIKMHLNLIEKDEDTDGDAGNKPITEEDIRELNTMIQDTGADLKRFLDFMGVSGLAEIRKNEIKKAVNALDEVAKKKRQK